MLKLFPSLTVLAFILSILPITSIAVNENLIANESQKMVAFTCDDVPNAGLNRSIDEIIVTNKKLLTALKKNQVPAIGFVNEKIIFQYPSEVIERISILQLWLDKGFDLGNHTYSHWSLSDVPLQNYMADVLRNEVVTKTLMTKKNLKLKYFRHPFLATGPTPKIRAQFENFLSKHDYVIAPVTIEFLDWIYNLIYSDAKSKRNQEVMERVVKEYLEFATKKIDFYENISQQLLGYPVRQILLFHDNELNADYIEEIIRLFKNKNYKMVTLEEALKDKAYQLPDQYFSPKGASWLIRWALISEKFKNFNWREEEPYPSKYILNKFSEMTNGGNLESKNLNLVGK